MLNKKGLWGKILLVILILLVAIFTILGITAYQVSNLMKVVEDETAKIQTSINLLTQQQDCTQINTIENSVAKITNEATSACKNPLISFTVSRIDTVPIKCENLSQIKTDFEEKISEAREYCENPEKFKAAISSGNISREELMTLAQKYGIKI